MASRRLYPDLNEPWSDVEDDERLDEGDTTATHQHFRDNGEETAPSVEDRSLSYSMADTDAVNLSDFEDYYLRHNRSSQRNSPGRNLHEPLSEQHPHARPPSLDSPLFPRGRDPGRGSLSIGVRVSHLLCKGWEGVSDGVRWFVAASLWKRAVVTSLLGLLCAMIFGWFKAQWSAGSSKDIYLECPSPAEGDLPPCIPDAELKVANVIVHRMADILHSRAAQYICSVGDVTTLTVSLAELKTLLSGITRSNIKNVFYLVLVNPHWHISWMDKANKTVTDWTYHPHPSDLLASTSPSLPLKCRFLLQLASLWHAIQWALLVLLGVALLYALVMLYRKRKRKQEAAVFALVGRILDVLKYHYRKSGTKKDLLPYLAIIHVRDMLIPPSERKTKDQVWSSAVNWIACHESRVRVETRRISGEDFEVWRWIQEDPPPTEIHSASSQSQASNAAGSHGNWHGSVFDHYPPEITTRVAPPTGTPSHCIRLKNMFDPVRRMSESQNHELENAVLERCHPHGAVVHVWVDKKSPYGCVYLKMGSLESAMGAYNALHGGWYKGKLVTAKYIPVAKYHKWFPVAANAKDPILQS